MVDTVTGKGFAFAIADGGSRQIEMSQVLPGLVIAVVETTLQRSQTQDDGEINRWLLKLFSEQAESKKGA